MLILMMIAASNAVNFSANIQIGKTLRCGHFSAEFLSHSISWIFVPLKFFEMHIGSISSVS